mgnify:FL=1|jgi:hypothetical protein
MFSESDIRQMQSLGLDQQVVMQQLEKLKRGTRYVELSAPATAGKGIQVFTPDEIRQQIEHLDHKLKDQKLLKFVPASGAATRMFKDLFLFLEKYNIASKTKDPALKEVYTLLDHLPKMAFYPDLKTAMAKHHIDTVDCLAKEKYDILLEYFLYAEGLNYATLPKALLKFHAYDKEERTAFEEHLVEGDAYARNADGKVYLHVTVSPEHHSVFEEHFQNIKVKYEKRFGCNYELSFSYQSPSTNTIALNDNNEPFRNDDGSLEFRPGGHGSLLQNLADIDADIIFIKNIDNVTLDQRRSDTILYKKLLTSLLITYQNRCFEFLKILESSAVSEKDLHAIELYAKEHLNIELPVLYASYSTLEKQSYLYHRLNRPIRVCGMVKRENEPGGGPFWVKNEQGVTTLQIVETSEIDTNKLQQEQILEKSEFFNPVDLVCAIKNYQGETFELAQFADDQRYFIAHKSKNGKSLKALEHPGLWNGAMADWISIFVAVPLSTFTPVKTVNDLLRKEHIII